MKKSLIVWFATAALIITLVLSNGGILQDQYLGAYADKTNKKISDKSKKEVDRHKDNIDKKIEKFKDNDNTDNDNGGLRGSISEIRDKGTYDVGYGIETIFIDPN